MVLLWIKTHKKTTVVIKKGLVLRSTGLWYDVQDEAGKHIRARLEGKIRLKNEKATNPVAVGDYVELATDPLNEAQASIKSVLPRQNYVSRLSPHKKAHAHIIAANLDQVILVVTLALPRTSLGFIDRFLAVVESFRIPCILVFNKSDIISQDPEGQAYQDEVRRMYEHIGYKTFAVSALADTDLSILQGQIKDKKTLFSGHSGVGKSTLLNRLAPHISAQKTQEISDFSLKGVHTTTFAEMFEVAPQTYIIDTPGIKEMGLHNIKPEEISHYFPEMRHLLNSCKYANCTHTHEPQCMVIKETESGYIFQSRYYNYLSMFRNEDNRK
ncbi:MAG: ribosome small subunit-dependent GTPase A [Cytophagales bacterium]|nr:MAG: ribosome small subunit-dependent GTPase A [Cytophagales bacterium]TAF62492.1 MAG: ribosome small subunit-dependent GTPase A [Cytophagales bacterium]